ncbi:MAG: UDP-N-acetylglucosamine 1-carboxyvinyltransferase [Defluviitaleaceae bacterium]|nr:UDP-N-acetylglucosamine 1-carboxyvinyltransferase [Defluviitaleaceae bacterium]
MGEYLIKGGNKIIGEIDICGAKNSILPILASVVLNENESIIHNVPKISDTFVAIDILKSIGCKVELKGSTIIVNSKDINNIEVPAGPVREMRSSIIFLGGILGRFKKVKISYPGGCELGARPIDFHIKAMRQLGATITEEQGFLMCEAKKLIGTRINLDFPSVGATQNIMLAAVFAKGETIISNAAKEPEIVDLQNFLNAMGASIKGAGTDMVVISGVQKLKAVEYKIMPDRIIAGTYLVATSITNGEILVKDVIPEHLNAITSKLIETGCDIKTFENSIWLKAPERLRAIHRLKTYPYPGFPTDMGPQFMTLLSIANGNSIVEETIFEGRNKHISEFMRMGANIVLLKDGMTSLITGVKNLNGTTVMAKDLRGGASLVLAGLCAEGETIVQNASFVERGYEHIEKDLKKLGANIVLR